MTTTLDRVVLRFAGDSGDGMQLVGDRFTELSAVFGNDLATLPSYPAEIRAPAGTVGGVSSFQVHISDHDILTPGDGPNVLIAMNPAALAANLGDVAPGSTLIVNEDAFDEAGLTKAGYDSNPLDDDSLALFTVYQVPMTSITVEATRPLGVKPRDAQRSKNFFALGLVCWMYTRPAAPVIDWIEKRFSDKAMVRDANLAAFRAGRNFGETAELFAHQVEVAPASLPPGTYRNIVGQHRRCLRPGCRRPEGRAEHDLRELPDHPGIGHPPRAVEAEELRRHDDAGRGRDRRRLHRHRGVLRRHPRSDRHVGPGSRPQGRGDRAGREPRAAHGHRRRPARRTVDRHAHEDRTDRSVPRHVRTTRGIPLAGRRRQVTLALLRRRLRGVPDRHHVPDTGHPPHRRLPGQRIRALAAARHRHPGADRPGLRVRAESRRPVLALSSRPRHSRPSLGDPGYSRSVPSDRWHRETRWNRRHQLSTRES